MEIKDTEGLTPIRDTARFESQPRTGNSTIDNIKRTIAEKLKSAAGALKERTGQQNATSPYADKASGWLDTAADYVRDLDPNQMKTDIQKQVRSNPGRSLLIVGAAGLVLGALLRRR